MNRIKILREERNMSQKELSLKLGVSEGSISLYENEGRKPSLEVLVNLSNIFDCSIDYLLGLDIKSSAFYDFSSTEIQNLIDDLIRYIEINKIRNLKSDKYIQNRIKEAILYEKTHNSHPPTEEQIYRELNNSLKALEKALEANKPNIINVYSSVHAGILSEMIEDIVDTEEIDINMLKGGKEFFGVKVKGDSMSPKYIEGDTIIVEKTNSCESGQDCIVAVNGNEAFLKRVFKSETGIMLQALNPNYEPLIFTNKDITDIPITIIGVVRELRRKI